jgi:hypothetical protein
LLSAFGFLFLLQGRWRLCSLCSGLVEVLIGMTIIAITTGQRIGKTNRALIMTMHMYQLNNMTAKKTLLHT